MAAVREITKNNIENESKPSPNAKWGEGNVQTRNCTAEKQEFVDVVESSSVDVTSPLQDESNRTSEETAYIPIRVLGRGAFGQAVLYRKVEVN